MEKNVKKNINQRRTSKKSYEAPAIELLGTLGELTRGAGTGVDPTIAGSL